MTMNKIFAKLREKNKGQYRMLAFCIFLSVLLISSFALMYLGPTVQDFIQEGGDTSKMAMLLMGATAVGCSIFTLYASMLFFRYKSREYGIFLALGESKKQLKKLLFKELALVTAGAAAAGLIAAIPASWLIWKLFEIFLVSTREMQYRFGITGFLVGIGFAVILALLLGIAARRFVKRSNIMDILRTQHQPEMVKKIPGWTFPLGIVLIPLGILLALGIPQIFVYVLGLGAPTIVNLFYLLSVAGIYLVLLNIVAKTGSVKNRKKFYKNMVSVNLMRFSARSTTRNMCVIVLLLFASMFACFYGMLYTNSTGYRDQGNSKGFAMHYPIEEEQITEEDIRSTAEEYQMQVEDYAQAEAANLVISYTHTDYTNDGKYVTLNQDDAKNALFFSASAYETLTGRNAEIPQGSYCTLTTTNYQENIWYFLDGVYSVLNPDTNTRQDLSFAGTLEYDNLANMSDPYAYVLNDSDYNTLTQGLSASWMEQVVLFNVADPSNSYDFAQALYAQYVEHASDLSDHVGYYDRWEEIQAQNAGETYMYGDPVNISLDNTQLRGNWRYAPDFLILTQQDVLQLYSVYILLCLYIFIITLAAASVMTYVRGISVAADNRDVFLSLQKLGADAGYQRRVLNSQLSKIFTYPGILGCGVGLLFSVIICGTNDHRYTPDELMNLGILLGISLLVLVFLYLMYRKVKKQAETIVGIHE